MNDVSTSYHLQINDATHELQSPEMSGDCPVSLSGLVERFKTDRRGENKVATVTVFADLTTIRIPEFPHQQPPGRGGIKQPIKEFSRSSRRSMLNAMAQMRNVGEGYFVHLTFPGKIHGDAKFVVTMESAKSALAALRKRIARKLPKAGGLWRMELKVRLSGASQGFVVPHYHIMIFGVDWQDKEISFRNWIAKVWNEIIDPDDLEHRSASTRTDIIVNRRHAMSYASKYTAKTGEDTDARGMKWGRRWGTFGNVDRTPAMVFECPADQTASVRREIRKFLEGRNKAAWEFAWNNTKKVGLVPVKPRRNRYAKRLTKLGLDDGFSILGLGDLSSDKWVDIKQSTVCKMVILPLLPICYE